MPNVPTHITIGRLQADYYITPEGRAVLNQPGGSGLYAAIGAAIWSESVGISARVGSNFNPDWITRFSVGGLQTKGVIATNSVQEHRNFFAYIADGKVRSRADIVGLFTRIGQPIPAILKDYDEHPPLDSETTFGPLAVRPDDFPAEYFKAEALHIAPCDFITHRTLPAAARSLGIKLITCDPTARYMQPSFKAELGLILADLDAVLTNEAKVRNFFRSETDDIWESAAAFGEMSVKFIVINRGAKGQYVYETASDSRWHVPAYPTKVVDATGGRDAYGGGFMVGIAQTENVVEAAVRGAISTSLVIEGNDPFYALGAHPRLAEARLNAQREMVRRI